MIFTTLPRMGSRRRFLDNEHKCYTSLWVGIGSAVVGAGTAIYSADQQRKNAHAALDAQKGLVTGLKYEPIDIEALKKEATDVAIKNATESLAIERSLTPDIANTRAELSKQVSDELALGGTLPADVINRVTMAGRTIGARSGIGSGSTVPLTASLLGLSSIDLANSRRAAAGSLLSANKLPVAGLDPGAVVSAEIADNAARNKFNVGMAGPEASLIDSQSQARAAQLGGQIGVASSLANLLGKGVGAYVGNKPGIVQPGTVYEGDPGM